MAPGRVDGFVAFDDDYEDMTGWYTFVTNHQKQKGELRVEILKDSAESMIIPEKIRLSILMNYAVMMNVKIVKSHCRYPNVLVKDNFL